MNGLAKLVCAIAVGAFVILGSISAKAQNPDSQKVNELFHSIRHHALLAEADAELLESYTRSPVSWETQSHRLGAMKEHVKDLADDFNQATTLRPEGSPWQQDAIDHLQPLLQGMADHINAAIEHLRQNQSKTRMQPWVDYVHANQEYATKTVELIRDYVSYGEAKATADELEKKLEVPKSAGDE